MSSIDNLRARVSGSLAPLLNRVEAMLDGLSPRDRKLLLGLVAFGLLVLVAGASFFMKTRLDQLERDIAARNVDLQFVLLQQAELDGSRDTIAKIEEQIRSQQGTAFTTVVDRAASKAEVRESLQGIREASESRVDNIEQKNHKVEFKRVPVDGFFKFLQELETGGYPLRITSANIKTQKTGDTKVLNVTLEVASFKLIDGETEG